MGIDHPIRASSARSAYRQIGQGRAGSRTVMRRLLTNLLVVAGVLMTAVLVAPPAAAGTGRHHAPDLVALGDSFAAGAGNLPYSDDAYARSESSSYA